MYYVLLLLIDAFFLRQKKHMYYCDAVAETSLYALLFCLTFFLDRKQLKRWLEFGRDNVIMYHDPTGKKVFAHFMEQHSITFITYMRHSWWQTGHKSLERKTLNIGVTVVFVIFIKNGIFITATQMPISIKKGVK